MATEDFKNVLSGKVPSIGYSINEILVQYGKKLVETDKDGNYIGGESPLFIAIKNSAPDDVLEAIINYYPQDLNKPCHKLTPLQFAKSVDNERVIKLLEKFGALEGGRRKRRKTNKKRKTNKRRKTGKKKRR
jgi:hypothetical protein